MKPPSDELETLASELLQAPSLSFATWDRRSAPQAPGVYAIWQGDRLIYVGMSGRSESQKSGLRGRLISHGSGRRSGDQFCVYVADRLVLPILTKEQIASIASNTVRLDDILRDFIHRELFFRFIVQPNPQSAFQLEMHLRRCGFGGNPPLLNPLAGGAV
jgi:hypothetical protein